MACSRPVLQRWLLAALTCLLVSPARPPPPSNVIVVDSSGGGDYTSIQSAVDAAQQGDVILVNGGPYAGFLVTNKELTILGDAVVRPSIQDAIRVQNLAAGKTLVLANLDSQGNTSSILEHSVGLYVSNSQGRVRIQDCSAEGGRGSTGSGAGGGAVIVSSTDVAFVGCVLRGGLVTGVFPFSDSGARGLTVSSSSLVASYGSAIQGNDGRLGAPCGVRGGRGGTAGTALDSFLFSSSSSFRGGRGGDCYAYFSMGCPWPGDGGDGLYSGGSNVHLLDSVTIHGDPGLPIYGPGACGDCAFSGYAGHDRVGSTYYDLPGSARTLYTSTLAQAGTTETVTVRGEPGDVVGLLVASSTATAQYVPGWHGMLLVPLRSPPVATRMLFLGMVPGSGVIHFPLDIPALPTGTAARSVFLQALLEDQQGQRYLSGARSLTILP